MTAWPDITLRYFDCRGRAQGFRYFLRLRNIPFTDERVPLSPGWTEWQALKPDRSRSGPFRKLPVLHWGEVLVAEMPVIHEWLQRKTGDAERLGEAAQLQHAMLASSCASELMHPAAMLLYADLMHPGADLAAEAQATVTRVRAHLHIMEETLAMWQWWEQLPARGMMLTDCLLWEVLSCADYLYGDALQLQQLPGLARFYRSCPGREHFLALLAEHPCPFTGRPGEAEAVARIHLALSTVTTSA